MNTSVIVDLHERKTGIDTLLMNAGAEVSCQQLKAGDYLINDEVLIERKTKDDFVTSLIQGRLFFQCAKIRKSGYTPLFLVEGNPLKTKHNITREAVKGAILSITVRWRIPIVYTSGLNETVATIFQIAHQNASESFFYNKKGHRSKVARKQAILFLQGLPTVGAEIANRLLKRFGSLNEILNANEDDLLQIEGLGSKKVKRIIKFLNHTY